MTLKNGLKNIGIFSLGFLSGKLTSNTAEKEELGAAIFKKIILESGDVLDKDEIEYLGIATSNLKAVELFVNLYILGKEDEPLDEKKGEIAWEKIKSICDQNEIVDSMIGTLRISITEELHRRLNSFYRTVCNTPESELTEKLEKIYHKYGGDNVASDYNLFSDRFEEIKNFFGLGVYDFEDQARFIHKCSTKKHFVNLVKNYVSKTK